MKYVESVLNRLDVVFEWLTALILGGMTLLIFLQVVFRYVLNSPLAWTEELARFLFIWMTFIAGYVGARRNKHIGVTALQKALPRPLGKMVASLCSAICVLFFAGVIFYTLKFWSKLTMQTSPALGIPISVVYTGMLVGCFFMAVWYLMLAIKVYTDKEEEVQKA